MGETSSGDSGSLDEATSNAWTTLDGGLTWFLIVVDYLYSVTVEPACDDGLGAVGTHLLSISGMWFWALALLILLFIPYFLFQKHLLPHLAGKWVGRCYFWPCVGCSIYGNHVEFKGEWWAYVDDEQPPVLLGQAPLFSSYLTTLDQMGVKAVINLCDEFKGPTRAYRRNGVSLLWLRTVDHLEPTVEAMRTACSFIEHHRKRGSGVYIHCKSGRGRSAAVAMAWLMHHGGMSVMEAQKKLLSVRKVRAKLWKQKNIIEFHDQLHLGSGGGGGGGGDSSADDLAIVGGRTLSYATTQPKGRRSSRAWSVAEQPPNWEAGGAGGEWEINVQPLEATETPESLSWVQSNLDGQQPGDTNTRSAEPCSKDRRSLVSTHL